MGNQLYKELQEQKDELLKRNNHLKDIYVEKKRIIDTNDIIDAMPSKKNVRGGIYGNIYQLDDFETKWKGTVFDTQRVTFATMNFLTLNMVGELKDGNYNNPFVSVTQDLTVDLLGYCDIVMASKNGPIIHLIDPFGSLTFPPLKKISNEEGMEYSGRMVLVKTTFNYLKKNPQPIAIKKLPFTLYDDLRTAKSK